MGNVLLCSFCNSWIQLIATCQERHKFDQMQSSSVHFSNSEHDCETDGRADQDQVQGNTPLELASSFEALELSDCVEPSSADGSSSTMHYMEDFMALAYNIEFEFNISQSGSCAKATKPSIRPDRSGLKSISCLQDILRTASLFHGVFLDEGAPFSVIGVQQWYGYLLQMHVPQSNLCVMDITGSI